MKSPYEPDAFVLEGIMTTLAPEPQAAPVVERVNIAPMGPIVDPAISHFIFRPFKTSTTYQNLKATGQGVFHVTDDACLITGLVCDKAPPKSAMGLRPAEKVRGLILAGACRYYELQVTDLDDREDRTIINARAIHAGRLRDFAGFNRARHALLEAAILVTRLHLTGPQPVLAELARSQTIVDKTGTDAEQDALRQLKEFVESIVNRSPRRQP